MFILLIEGKRREGASILSATYALEGFESVALMWLSFMVNAMNLEDWLI
jgi:hypothetical protein